MPKVILFEFAGRQANLELQLPFIRRILDEHPNVEYHVWDFAHTQTDADYLNQITGDRITVRADFSERYLSWNNIHKHYASHHRLGWNKVYKHYANQPEYRDAIFAKLDDDVVFLQTQRFTQFLETIETYPDHIISANVINNGACTPTQPALWNSFHQLPDPTNPNQPLPLLDVHKSLPYAAMCHNHFFNHHTELLRQKIELIPTQDWLSINAIGYNWNMARKIAGLVGSVPHPPHIAGRRFPQPWGIGDESACNILPRIIMKGFTAAHLGFGPQKIPEHQAAEWRRHYRDIGRHYLELPPTRLQAKLPEHLSPTSHADLNNAEPDQTMADWAIRSGWDTTGNDPTNGRFIP